MYCMYYVENSNLHAEECFCADGCTIESRGKREVAVCYRFL